jgi:hypothetical protein
MLKITNVNSAEYDLNGAIVFNVDAGDEFIGIRSTITGLSHYEYNDNILQAWLDEGNVPTEYVALPELPVDLVYEASALRKSRDELLRQTDFSQLGDAPLTDTQKTAYATYRQSLRDITSQSGWPTEVTFPTKPE